MGNTSLETVVLPMTVNTIGKMAFKGCTALHTVDLSKTTITSIESGTFAGCGALYSIRLPITVEKIAEDALKGTPLKGHFHEKDFLAGVLAAKDEFYTPRSPPVSESATCTGLDEYLMPDDNLNIHKFLEENPRHFVIKLPESESYECVDMEQLRGQFSLIFKSAFAPRTVPLDL
mmetsp:Transcript_14486/g.26798  ORF Transcript_14486/g.26798 Transcript_14486/m.26798 type:complete len:175 (-) Transcript_14486:457-981(-)